MYKVYKCTEQIQEYLYSSNHPKHFLENLFRMDLASRQHIAAPRKPHIQYRFLPRRMANQVFCMQQVHQQYKVIVCTSPSVLFAAFVIIVVLFFDIPWRGSHILRGTITSFIDDPFEAEVRCVPPGRASLGSAYLYTNTLNR